MILIICKQNWLIDKILTGTKCNKGVTPILPSAQELEPHYQLQFSILIFYPAHKNVCQVAVNRNACDLNKQVQCVLPFSLLNIFGVTDCKERTRGSLVFLGFFFSFFLGYAPNE